MALDLGGYVDVAERIREFREKYPDGALQPNDRAKPYTIEVIGDKTFIVYVAAAYRGPDDMLPGVGIAWEQFPGATNFTKNSELQNAETSAWGRAIVAALAADTKKGVSSADEVRNRQAEQEQQATPSTVRAAIAKTGRLRGLQPSEIADDFAAWVGGDETIGNAPIDLLTGYLEYLNEPKQEALLP